MSKLIPNHIAIIPDGNRRWAREHKFPTFEGHRRGFDVGIKIGRKIRSLGVNTTTFWAFSTENWNRTPGEINYLMNMYEAFIEKNLKEALKEKIRIIHLGRKDRIPKSLLKKIKESEEKTKSFTKYFLNVALDYGGRDEIIRAIQKISNINPFDKLRVDAERSRSIKYQISNISEENFNKLLDTKDQPYPNPDLIIRTSGEQRTSGLMIWQGAYAEYIFLNKHFPDLKDEDIDYAVEEYSKRQRRFGK